MHTPHTPHTHRTHHTHTHTPHTHTHTESNDLDRYGLQAVVDSVKDITQTDPHKMFEHLFRATLDYRLTEDTFSRVRKYTFYIHFVAISLLYWIVCLNQLLHLYMYLVINLSNSHVW